MSDEPGRAAIHQVCKDVADLALTDEIDAISVVIVLPDGDIRTLTAFREKTKLPLLAGMSVAQTDFVLNYCKLNYEN